MQDIITNSINQVSQKANFYIEKVLKECLRHIGENPDVKTFERITKVFPDPEDPNRCEYYIDYTTIDKILLATFVNEVDLKYSMKENNSTVRLRIKVYAIYDK